MTIPRDDDLPPLVIPPARIARVEFLVESLGLIGRPVTNREIVEWIRRADNRRARYLSHFGHQVDMRTAIYNTLMDGIHLGVIDRTPRAGTSGRWLYHKTANEMWPHQ